MLDLNTRTPLMLAHEYGHDIAAKNKGGIIFVGSNGAYQGSPFQANYAATKAYQLESIRCPWL